MRSSPRSTPDAGVLKGGHAGAVIALLAFGVFATHDVLVKTLGATYSPVQIIFFSVLFGFPVVTIALLGDRTDANLRPRHPGWTVLRTAATVVTGLCAFYAFSVLPLAQTYAILFAAPLIITLLAVPMLGETIRLRRVIAVIAGFIGVMVVLQPGANPLSLGHLAALTAATGSALAALIVRRLGNGERGVVLLLYPMAANFVVMGAALPFVYRPMPALDLGMVAAVAVMGALGTVLIIHAYRRSEAGVVAPMQYSQILWASAYGAIFFDERPEANVVLGAAIIIGSGIYILWREGRPKASFTRPVLRTLHLRQDTGTLPRIGILLGRRRGPESPLANPPPDV
ncbi:EamA family transporter [Rhodobacteraceae bacterium 2CG4]|uniref:EamA family transporter n=1 Tax=Halovulum marinum TaxID=2662447 RepID=A0A6L5Z356_9RHOB|nr:DMT family transporter [Halovulum marinum]MSU90442.1 EamA family transporter [Halovulum marinum]